MEFKQASCCENHRVGDDGSVWSRIEQGRWGRIGHWKKLRLNWRRGYFFVVLSCNGRRRSQTVARLVLEAFVGPCPQGMEACHNNGDARDNRPVNLRWDTHLSNIWDKVRHGTLVPKLTKAQAVEIRRRALAGESLVSLGREFGVVHSTIFKIKHGKVWRHAGEIG